MGNTHAAAGGLFAAALVPPTASLFGIDIDPEEVLIATGIGVVAGLLPDIDHPNSMITAGVVPGAKFLGPLGRPLGFFLSIPPRIIGAGARTKLKHRGGTHSALFMALWTVLAAPLYAVCIAAGAFILATILGIIAAILPIVPELNPGDVVSWLFNKLPGAMPLIMMSVFWGYFSHLLTDSMTNVPVPWPWPFSKGRYSILPKGLRITTDSFTEKTLVRPLILVLLAIVLLFRVGIPVLQEVSGIGTDDIPGISKEDEASKKQAQAKKEAQEKAKAKKQAQARKRKQAQAKKKQAQANKRNEAKNGATK